VRPDELQEAPLIAREPRSGTRAMVEGKLKAIGVEITPALEFGGIEAIKNAVLAGLGVAFVSRHAVQLEERLGLLVAIPVEGLSLRRPFFCLCHRDRHPSPALEAFLSFIRISLGDDSARE
jgi:DNA-binding transcriptional LysR family regulator